jgi:hypothetical protein
MSHDVLELYNDLVSTTSANESKEGGLCTTATTTVSIHHLESRTTQNQEGENDKIMHMFATSGVYIQLSPRPSPFMMMGRQGCIAALKITLSRGQLKYKKGRMIRTCLSWIQSHPHEAILRHLLNTVNSFLCSLTNYFENQLLPNNLIIVRSHGDEEENERDIKRVLERQGDAHIKVEIQSNSEFQSLTLSLTRSPGPTRLQIDVQDTYEIRFGCSIYARKEEGINFPMAPVPGPNKIGLHQNCSNNFNIESPTHPEVVHIKTNTQAAYNIQLGHS